MTHHTDKCAANCGFCPQARGSRSSGELLSRVTWPTFPTQKVIETLADSVIKSKIRRVCIQALNYPTVFAHLEALVKEIKGHCPVPVSVSCQPLKKENIMRLAEAEVDRIGIALDAATEEVFDRVKGKGAGCPYRWEKQFELLEEAVAIFGRGNVSTHIIVGLGENERQAAETIQRCVDTDVLPALFAFSPIRGTALQTSSPPHVDVYRRLQIARYLIVNFKARVENMQFSVDGKILGFGIGEKQLKGLIEEGSPFRTSGCPDCNRPFYNERPSGPIYNYPEKLNSEDIGKVKAQLETIK